MTIDEYTLEPNLRSDLPIHPGELLADEIQERGLTIAQLARAMRRPPGVVRAIACGKMGITARSALELEASLGISARLWMGLQAEFELATEQERSAIPTPVAT